MLEVETANLVKHVIKRNQPQIRQTVYHMPFANRNKVDNVVLEMLSLDVIQPSQSP